MKGEIEIRGGDGHLLGEFRPSAQFGQGGCQKAVMLLCLVNEPEETEEDEGAKDGSPSGGLERINDGRLLVQQDPGVLEDTRVSQVRVIPGDPWADVTPKDVPDYPPGGQRDREAEISGGQGDKTPVAVWSQVAVGGDQLFEFLSPLQGGADGEGWDVKATDKHLEQGKNGRKLTPVVGRNERDGEGPRVNENVSRRGVPGGRRTAVVLVDVESMARDNVFWEAKGVESMETKQRRKC